MGVYDYVTDEASGAAVQFKGATLPSMSSYSVGSEVASQGVLDGIYLASGDDGVVIVDDGIIVACHEGTIRTSYGKRCSPNKDAIMQRYEATQGP